jgi:hypothetical protein
LFIKFYNLILDPYSCLANHVMSDLRLESY